jgi:MoaA/NifB/PqqE/SkfB family radical SAM enzyme
MCPRGTGSLANISEGVAPSKFVNNDNFRAIRQSLAEGVWPEHCKSCQDQESRGQESYRQKSNKHLKSTDKNNTIKKSWIEYIEVRFSNACNLSCRHCAPDYSSKWNSILKRVERVPDDYSYDIKNLVREWPNQSWTKKQVDELLVDLIKNCPNLNRIDVGGGEPLYQKQFWQFLEGIQAHPNRNNMYMNIVSNFNTPVDYEKLSEYMLHFNRSQIKISVDGGSNLYNYFRNGTYESILNNIQTFRNKNKKTILEATNTITPYQILDLENIVNDMLLLPVDRLHHSFVQYPTYLGIDVLFNQRRTLIKKVKRIKKKLYTQKKSLQRQGAIRMTEMIIHALQNSRECKKDVDAFIYYTNRIDTIKNQNFSSVFNKPVEEMVW